MSESNRRPPRAAGLSRRLAPVHGLNPLLRPLRLGRTAARRALLRAYPPDRLGPLVGVEGRLPGGLRMSLDPRSYIEWEVLFTGYEPEVRELLRRALRPGAVAIDIGANCGAHTLVMAAACRPGRVVACEPNPTLRDRLVANVALNALDNVAVRPWAVAATPGRVVLQVPSDPVHTGGASLLAGVHEHLDGAVELEVDAVTLDQLVEKEGLQGVDLVKIDVEGVEAAVLQGGAGLLSRDRPILAFEYTRDWWRQAGASLADVLASLESLGYRCRAVTWRGLRDLPADPPHRLNVWAVSSVR